MLYLFVLSQLPKTASHFSEVALEFKGGWILREIIFDTETTGLDKNEDRIIEIGCVEMDKRFLTGRHFHVYINPDGRPVHPDAFAVHGISDTQLADKPKFCDIAQDFLKFIEGAKLVAHNAMFDMGFINAELMRMHLEPIANERVVDTLAIARRKHPMGPNNLDALCKRYGIDNSHRQLHGALLDAEILSHVYIELMGGKQGALSLGAAKNHSEKKGKIEATAGISVRKIPLPPRLSEAEIEAHHAYLAKMGKTPLWYKNEPQ